MTGINNAALRTLEEVYRNGNKTIVNASGGGKNTINR